MTQVFWIFQVAVFTHMLEPLGNTLLLFPVVDFPTPKTELVQKFHVQYLGALPVDRPVGKWDVQFLGVLPVHRPVIRYLSTLLLLTGSAVHGMGALPRKMKSTVSLPHLVLQPTRAPIT
jgi:hypothetical protein